jgi:hypothetical protein
MRNANDPEEALGHLVHLWSEVNNQDSAVRSINIKPGSGPTWGLNAGDTFYYTHLAGPNDITTEGRAFCVGFSPDGQFVAALHLYTRAETEQPCSADSWMSTAHGCHAAPTDAWVPPAGAPQDTEMLVIATYAFDLPKGQVSRSTVVHHSSVFEAARTEHETVGCYSYAVDVKTKTFHQVSPSQQHLFMCGYTMWSGQLSRIAQSMVEAFITAPLRNFFEGLATACATQTAEQITNAATQGVTLQLAFPLFAFACDDDLTVFHRVGRVWEMRAQDLPHLETCLGLDRGDLKLTAGLLQKLEPPRIWIMRYCHRQPGICKLSQSRD